MSLLLFIITSLVCNVTNGHIIYGNEILNIKQYGVPSVYTVYNDIESLKIFGLYNSEATGINFTELHDNNFELNITLIITNVMYIDNEGYCGISLNSKNILLKPGYYKTCQKNSNGKYSGVLYTDNMRSKCDDNIQLNSYMNIVISNIKNNYVGNGYYTSSVYINGKILSMFQYVNSSYFAFQCYKANAFITNFTYKIKNGGNQTIPMDSHTMPSTTKTNATSTTPQTYNVSAKQILDFWGFIEKYIAIILVSMISILILCVAYVVYKKVTYKRKFEMLKKTVNIEDDDTHSKRKYPQTSRALTTTYAQLDDPDDGNTLAQL